jgi:multidrug resistance protein, MATE family
MTDQSLSRHVRRTFVLAWPMILSRIGLVTMSMTDVVVLGRAGARELADYILGQAVYDSLLAMSVGLLLGVPVLVAREMGAGNEAATRIVLRRGLVLALILGGCLTLLLQFAGALYALTGQAPDLAARAARVTGILAAAAPCIGLYYVCAAYLEARHQPLPGFVAIAAANLLNLGFNLIFVFGPGPLPAMGAAGCAFATVVTFGCAAIGMMVYLRKEIRAVPGVGSVQARQTAGAISVTGPPTRELVRIGLASGGSFLFEAASFSILVLLIGHLGPLALAAHGVLFQFLALSFMMAFGIAGARQVRVGNAWGRGDAPGIARAGWIGLALASLCTGTFALLLSLGQGRMLGLFSSDGAIIAAALPVVGWMLAAMIFDGGQTVLNSACRGRGDTWVPTAMQFVSYLLVLVLVPSAWILAFPLGNGLTGIYQAIVLASVFSVTGLAWRFRRLTPSGGGWRRGLIWR